MLARSIAGAGQDIATVVLREQERNDTLRTEDAFNQLRNKQLDLSLGQENGFANVKGGDAVKKPVLNEWSSKFDESANQIEAGLGSDRQRERFRQRAAVAKASFQGDILRHVSHETDVYAKGVLQSTLDTETRNIGAAPQDELNAGIAQERVNAAIETEGQRIGQTPEQIKVAKEKALDHLWTARLEAWRLVDPVGAIKAFQDNQQQIGPAVRVRLAESLYRDAAPVLAAELNSGGGVPVTATQLAKPGAGATTAHVMEYEKRAAVESARAEELGGKLPRGVRNNNPGNIISGPTQWDGQIDGADPRYASFASPEAGIRALGKNLLAYQAKGIDTVEGIVGRWAPATENDTAEYVKTVAKKLGVDPREPLNLKDRKTLTALATAIIEQENGVNPYSAETVGTGLDAAVSGKQFAYEAKRSPGYSVASLQNMSASDVLGVVTGNAVIDRLPPDQKLGVFQLARTQSNQGMSQLREAMKQRVVDTSAAFERGLDAPNAPNRAELIATFGQLDGEKVAGDLDLARRFGQDVRSVQNLPSTQQAALLATRTPAPGEGFDVAQRRHDMLARAIDNVQKERQQDPALSVMRNSPQVQAAYQTFAKGEADPAAAAQAYASASLAEQQRLEVRNPQVLTKDMVDSIAKRFAEPPAQGENVASVMRGMVDQWGRYWPQVGAQLKKSLPSEAVVIGLGVKPEAEALLAEAVRMKPEALRQGMPEADVRDLKDRVRRDFEPLQRSLAWQSGGIDTYDNFADSAEKLSTLLVQKGMKPKDASAKAWESLVGFKYEFEESWRVPKAQLGGDTTMSTLRAGAQASQFDIGSESPVLGAKVALAIPRTPGGVRPADAEKQWRDTIRDNGFWVTSPGDGGLSLYVKSGLGAQPVLDATGMPVRRTWQELSTVGNSVRAAHMKDVYKPGVRAP